MVASRGFASPESRGAIPEPRFFDVIPTPAFSAEESAVCFDVAGKADSSLRSE
jgi:hypothetical protein